MGLDEFQTFVLGCVMALLIITVGILMFAEQTTRLQETCLKGGGTLYATGNQFRCEGIKP